jgi:hypothetical protein
LSHSELIKNVLDDDAIHCPHYLGAYFQAAVKRRIITWERLFILKIRLSESESRTQEETERGIEESRG